MPLIEQQDVVVAYPSEPRNPRHSLEQSAIEELRKQLLNYPPCRIVSISTSESTTRGYALVAVIETI